MITAPVIVPYHLRQYSIAFAAGVKDVGGQKIKFVNPNTGNYDGNLRNAGKLHKKGIPTYSGNMLIPRGSKAGPPVIVCGSGNSLKEEGTLAAMREWVSKGAVIFACKQAIKYLHEQGFKIDYGVTMDPGAHIARPEKIFKSPGTIHLVASSSDPLLFDYFLTNKDFPEWLADKPEEEQKRILDRDFDKWKDGDYIPPSAGETPAKVMIFHSATGYEKEVNLYNSLFKEPSCMGGGYNVVNRAVSAALFMGASKIILAGCDCGWRTEDSFYVDGSNNRPGTDMFDKCMVEGTDDEGKPIDNPDARPWNTRPDMLASGVSIVKLARKNKDKFVILGDTLPKRLWTKTDEFLDKCASFQK